jgi:hypothetical protein
MQNNSEQFTAKVVMKDYAKQTRLHFIHLFPAACRRAIRTRIPD